MNKARSASRPRKRPRVRESEARRPRTTDKTVTAHATWALTQADCSQRGSANRSSYQRRVQPGGGKISHCELPKESAAMKTMGSSRNNVTSAVIATRTHFHQPKR